MGEAIERLAADGASILVAEQKTDLIAAVASRVVVLDAGRVALHGLTRQVLEDPALVELGVAEPSAVRLRRVAEAAGVTSARLAGVLADV